MPILNSRSVIPFSEWSLISAPAAATKASATVAAAGVGVRRIMSSLSFSLSAIAAQGEIEVQVRDGATGVGPVLWQMGVNAPVGGNINFSLSGLDLLGSVNTAMTIEFSAAPAAGNFERVNAQGCSVQ